MQDMSSLQILVTESTDFSSRAVDLLGKLGDVILSDIADRDDLLCAVGISDVLWVRLRHRLDKEVLDAAPNLKVIVSPTTGLNHIDLEEAEKRDIEILSLLGETEFLKDIRATAEHTIALILSLLRNIPGAIDHVKRGDWDRDRFRGRELFGRTAGVVGYGRLGRIVARYLNAFGMNVLSTDPNVTLGEVDEGVKLVPLNDLLQSSDLVILHVNYNTQNHRFFGREQFTAMKVGSWFINTSRGELVDEVALLDALKSEHLAGAALDVLYGEGDLNSSSNILINYARQRHNLLITPHVGGCTFESMGKTELFMAEKLLSFLSNN